MFWLQMQDEKEGDHLENVTRHQPWARYLEGDNILTKIGSDRDRGGEPDTSRNSGHVGMPNPEFSSIFPGRFRSEKIEGKREKLRKIKENWGQSRLFLTNLELF